MHTVRTIALQRMTCSIPDMMTRRRKHPSAQTGLPVQCRAHMAGFRRPLRSSCSTLYELVPNSRVFCVFFFFFFLAAINFFLFRHRTSPREARLKPSPFNGQQPDWLQGQKVFFFFFFFSRPPVRLLVPVLWYGKPTRGGNTSSSGVCSPLFLCGVSGHPPGVLGRSGDE
ncbi:hypothetical protein BX600DRAFT_219903 [Xylariales sp. PMI_506]|nr:hypothetical protein BX600DRAFT_219903 [Xylariales sp. PMI_506]